jgi:sialate O-acetylesterase
MPAIFGDHMVLQEGAKLPVWGWASPGEKVSVAAGETKAATTADASGKWRVDLAPLKPGSSPVTLTVTGSNTLKFTDVLVGEVWICSGQSNMEFGANMDGLAATTIPQATEPQIRLFLVQRTASATPLDDVANPSGLSGSWQLCTPETLGGKWGWNGFSAVGYYFGRELHEKLKRPVGLIESSWGGTPAQAWVSPSGLEKPPAIEPYATQYEKFLAGYPAAKADYPERMAAFKTAWAAWLAGDGATYAAQVKAWKEASKAALAANQMAPKAPRPPAGAPRAPAPAEGGAHMPSTLYNGMISPLLPFAIKGAIWYQGEANASQAFEYRALFGRLISDWREKWGEGNFPFIFTQLASFRAGAVQSWPYLREAQAQTLALPDTGMVTAIDIGNPANVHPTDKLDVAKRLSLVARKLAYGDDQLVAYGPMFSAVKKTGGSTMTLTFKHTGTGLVIGQAPWTAPGVAPLPTDKLVGFTIAGSDHNFVPADARIVGDMVEVSSGQIAAPVAVRYDWANAPEGNLYNQEKLPAFPFRTDDWSDPVAMGQVKAVKETPPAATP